MQNIDYRITIDQQLPPIIKTTDNKQCVITFNYSSSVKGANGHLYIYNLTNSKQLYDIPLTESEIMDSSIKVIFQDDNQENELINTGVFYKIQFSFNIYGEHFSNFGISKCISDDSFLTIFENQNNRTILNYYTNDKENYLEFYKYTLVDNNTNNIVLSKNFQVVEDFQTSAIDNLLNESVYDDFKTLELEDFKSKNLIDGINKFTSNNNLNIEENISTYFEEKKDKKYYEYDSKYQRYNEIDTIKINGENIYQIIENPKDSDNGYVCMSWERFNTLTRYINNSIIKNLFNNQNITNDMYKNYRYEYDKVLKIYKLNEQGSYIIFPKQFTYSNYCAERQEDSIFLIYSEFVKNISRSNFCHTFYEKSPNTNYYQLTADDNFGEEKLFKLNESKKFAEIFNIELSNKKNYLLSSIYFYKQNFALQHYGVNAYRSILIPLNKLNNQLSSENNISYIISYANSEFGLNKPQGCLLNSNSLSNKFNSLEFYGDKSCKFNLNADNNFDYLFLYFGRYETMTEIKDILKNLVIYKNSSIAMYPPIYKTIIEFNDIPELKYSDDYTLKFLGKTHLLQEINVEKQILKNNIFQDIWFPATIETKNLLEEGCIDISLQPMQFDGAETKPLIGQFQLLRADKRHNFENWQIITKFNLTTGLFNVSVYKDYSVEQGMEYLYGIEQINEYGVVSDIIKSYKPVCANFDDMFLIDKKAKIKIKFNPKVSSFKTTKQEQKQETLGSKYPYIMRGQNLSYKEIPISGLISFNMDDSEIEKFIDQTQDDVKLDAARNLIREQTWNNFINQVDDKRQQNIVYTSTDLTSDNFFRERQFKLALLNWLNNNEYKLLKTPAEGNYIVQLLNVNLSPNETVGRMLHTFSATAIEVADFTFENLNNLINLNKDVNIKTTQLKIETQSLYMSNIEDEDNIKLDSINPVFKQNFKINNLESANNWIQIYESTGQNSNNQTDSNTTENTINSIVNIYNNSFNNLKDYLMRTRTLIAKQIFEEEMQSISISITLPFICQTLFFNGLPEKTKIEFKYRIKNNDSEKWAKIQTLELINQLKKLNWPLSTNNQEEAVAYIGKTGSLQIENAVDIVSFTISFTEAINNFYIKSNNIYHVLRQASFTYSYLDDIYTDFDNYKLINPKRKIQLITASGERNWINFDKSSNLNRYMIDNNNTNLYNIFVNQSIKLDENNAILTGTHGKILYSKNQYIHTNSNIIKRVTTIPATLKNSHIYQIKIYRKPLVGEIKDLENEPKLINWLDKTINDETFTTYSNVYKFLSAQSKILYSKGDSLVYVDEANYLRYILKNYLQPAYSFYIGTDDVNYRDYAPYLNQLYYVSPMNEIIISDLDNLEFFWLGAGLLADISYLTYSEEKEN